MVKKVSILCLIVCLLFSFSPFVYGYTVDDVRDLLGKQRVDDIYTQKEIDEIIRQYNEIEKANQEYEFFELAKQINLSDTKLLEEYKRLEEDLSIAKEELAKAFQSGLPLKEVLKKKSRVESIMHEIDSLRDLGYDIEINYIPNIWSEEYEKVKNVVASISTQYDIGEVGKNMKLPFDNSFDIYLPFGFTLNETRDSVTMHNGLDFLAEENTVVFAQWNGVVSNVYDSVQGGKTIEISHGPDLKTIYMHLNKVDVKIGQGVSQYQYIGKSGNTGVSDKPHLHFGVYLDGEYVNPIFLYGQEGLRAFRTYVSENPSRNSEKYEIENNLKDYPSKIVDKKEEEETEKIVENPKQNGFNTNSFWSGKNAYLEELEKQGKLMQDER